MGVQTVMIVDETFGGETINSFALQFLNAEVTVADIIRERVQHEVDLYNRKASTRFMGLVQPTDAEKQLNGYQMKKPRKIRADTQIETALSAFVKNGFIVLIDDAQVENLTQKVALRDEMEISFLKLTPLVGG